MQTFDTLCCAGSLRRRPTGFIAPKEDCMNEGPVLFDKWRYPCYDFWSQFFGQKGGKKGEGVKDAQETSAGTKARRGSRQAGPAGTREKDLGIASQTSQADTKTV